MSHEPLSVFPVLETPRFLLRDTTTMDAKAILEIYSNDEVVKYYNMPILNDLDQAKRLIEGRRQRLERGSGIRWAIARKEDNRVIGSAGFSQWIREWRKAELGYEIHRDYWNQGIATESLREILKYGFAKLELNRIEGMAVPENTASLRVLEKLGFQREGHLRQYAHWKSEFHDIVLSSLLKEEFLTTI